jgi:eukaryotic-like serine/threonine-protein kinase
MTPERYQKAGYLYHAVLEIEPEARSAFLEGACGGDEELRREVESLLAAHDKVGNYFVAPAVEVAAKLLAERQNPSLMGQSFSHYQMLSLIGAGGMGEVYLAEDTLLGRKVALKLLPKEFTEDRERVRRFEQEARATSSLSHPNIVMIFEVGQVEGRHFIATEYIDGQTLRERLTGARLELREALEVSAQIAGALEAAHLAGIVHRDIKPENIMLRRDGYVKILDFGLAKLAERPAADADAEARRMSLVNTSPGVVMGTANYMSPEQARGLPVDARTDVWSLGVVLYELVAGQLPFDGATATDVIISIAEREPVPLAKWTPEVPIPLEEIVKKALAKDREERYQTAKDLLIDLQGLRHELAIEAEVERYKHPTPSRGLAATTSNRQMITSRFFPFALTRSRIQLLTALLGMLVIAGLVSALFFRQSSTPVPPIEIQSLAVLPLENLSGDTAQDYFADGLTDALIGDLAKIGELRVISRTSSMHFKGTKKSLPEIAGELKVDAVVEGTVQRSGERVRIRVQLIHAATDRHLWAETYERDMRDVLGLQSEIARAIAREVQIKTTPADEARLTPRPPVNPKAFDDYLQGRYLYWNKRTEENLRKAIEYFQSAIREDPAYALAYAGLADCHNALGSVQFSALPPDESRRRAEEAAEQALKIDSELAEAHSALGTVKLYNWDWEAAEREFKRAIELNSNYANAHNYYAGYLMSRGRAEESLAASNRARELDPLSLSISVQRGFLLGNARRYDEASEQLRRVIAMDPNHYQSYWFLGHIYAFNGQFDEAVAASEKAVSLSGRAPGALGMLGLVYGLTGRKGEAAEVLNELLELNKRRYVTPAVVAWVYIGLGDKDQAFVWLEKAYQEHSFYIAYFKANPIADSLRSDPRFADLVRRVGLPQ